MKRSTTYSRWAIASFTLVLAALTQASVFGQFVLDSTSEITEQIATPYESHSGGGLFWERQGYANCAFQFQTYSISASIDCAADMQVDQYLYNGGVSGTNAIASGWASATWRYNGPPGGSGDYLARLQIDLTGSVACNGYSSAQTGASASSDANAQGMGRCYEDSSAGYGYGNGYAFALGSCWASGIGGDGSASLGQNNASFSGPWTDHGGSGGYGWFEAWGDYQVSLDALYEGGAGAPSIYAYVYGYAKATADTAGSYVGPPWAATGAGSYAYATCSGSCSVTLSFP